MSSLQGNVGELTFNVEITRKETELWNPTRLVLIRFPTSEQARHFYDSPEYQQVLQISKASARRTVVILEGL